MKFTVPTRRLSLLSLAATVGLLTAMVGNSAFAVVLAYDPFLTTGDNNANPASGQYFKGSDDLGTNPIGGQNPIIGPGAFYTGPWIQSGGDAQSVKGGSLTYPNFPNLKGRMQEEVQFSCCSFGRNGRAIADVTGSGENGLGVGRDAHTFYQSFLVNYGTTGTDDPTQFGKHGYEMWNGGVGDAFLAIDLFVNHFSGVLDLTLNVTSPSGTVTQTVAGNLDLIDLAAANGGTHLVVMKYEFDPANPDVVTMYLDPTDSIESNWVPASASGVRMPKPTETGIGVTLDPRDRFGQPRSCSALAVPVMPVIET